MKTQAATRAVGKLRRPPRIEWSEEELQLLHEHYPTLTVKTLQALYLPGRTAAAIKLQARRERIRGAKSWSHWTPDEITMLHTHYLRMSRKEFQQRHLPHRTVPSIVKQALALGLRKQLNGIDG